MVLVGSLNDQKNTESDREDDNDIISNPDYYINTSSDDFDSDESENECSNTINDLKSSKNTYV